MSSSAAVPPVQPPNTIGQDAVTAAQAKLDDLGQLFYSSIGEVWQQAAPVPVDVGAQPTSDARDSTLPNAALAHRWAAQLGSAARELQSAVDQLGLSASRTDGEEEADGHQRLLAEEQRSVVEGEQLLVTIESAEQWLAELQQTIRLVNSRVVAAKTAQGSDVDTGTE